MDHILYDYSSSDKPGQQDDKNMVKVLKIKVIKEIGLKFWLNWTRTRLL